MNKGELIKNVVDVLRENNIKKPISVPKQVFHISDDEGNKKDFRIKQTHKTAIYTKEDVTRIIDACMYIIGESLKKGDPVSITGFGSLGLKYRKPRTAKDFNTGEEISIEGHYLPKFNSGKDLRMCAKVYELSLKDRLQQPEPIYDESDEMTENDGD